MKEQNLRNFSRVVDKYFSADRYIPSNSFLNYTDEKGWNKGVSGNFCYNFVQEFTPLFAEHNISLDVYPFQFNGKEDPLQVEDTLNSGAIFDRGDHIMYYIALYDNNHADTMEMIWLELVQRKSLYEQYGSMVLHVKTLPHVENIGDISWQDIHNGPNQSRISTKKVSDEFLESLLDSIDNKQTVYCQYDTDEKGKLTAEGRAAWEKDLSNMTDCIKQTIDEAMKYLGTTDAQHAKRDFDYACDSQSSETLINKLFYTTAAEHQEHK